MDHQITALRYAACWQPQKSIRPFSQQQDPIQNCSGRDPSLATKLSRQKSKLPALLMCDGLKLCFHTLSANGSWLRRSNEVALSAAPPMVRTVSFAQCCSVRAILAVCYQAQPHNPAHRCV
jgi:hypothetical protein